ncbi:MAG: 1-deoxy-D-xylulose-5-phosphate reductoisomerase, partial [Polaromonas sp.]|nr:1-deoxy-D-xylulose-5-phosphate reductoisomerase [Polaromonas sp.]
PFRTRTPDSLRDVTPEQACAHPNWSLGRLISVDSATMMNKALEVIEARYLFRLAPAQIEVVIHPQSIIHSMVQYRDTSVVAQLGTPDMRVPIAYGLAWPGRISSGAQALDFRALATMTFSVPDDLLFPGLPLAWEVLEAPAGTTAVLNAANEVAVAAFLEKRIRFDQIHAVNRATLDAVSAPGIRGIGDLLALDERSRAVATGLAAKLTT